MERAWDIICVLTSVLDKIPWYQIFLHFEPAQNMGDIEIFDYIYYNATS